MSDARTGFVACNFTNNIWLCFRAHHRFKVSVTLFLKNHLIGTVSVPYDQLAILRCTDTQSEREWNKRKQKWILGKTSIMHLVLLTKARNKTHSFRPTSYYTSDLHLKLRWNNTRWQDITFIYTTHISCNRFIFYVWVEMCLLWVAPPVHGINFGQVSSQCLPDLQLDTSHNSCSWRMILQREVLHCFTSCLDSKDIKNK